jgi:hypothetical protein
MAVERVRRTRLRLDTAAVVLVGHLASLHPRVGCSLCILFLFVRSPGFSFLSFFFLPNHQPRGTMHGMRSGTDMGQRRSTSNQGKEKNKHQSSLRVASAGMCVLGRLDRQ